MFDETGRFAYPSTYVTTTHVISFFTLFVYTLAFYCLYAQRKTPLRSYALLMAHQIMWIFLAEQVAATMSPVVHSDVFATYPAGVLYHIPHLSTFAIYTIFLVLQGGVTASTIQLMLYRLSAIIPAGTRNFLEDFSFGKGTKLAFLIPIGVAVILPLLDLEQETNKKIVAKKLGITSPFFWDEKLLVIEITDNFKMFVYAWTMILYMFVAVCLVVYFYARYVLRKSRTIFSGKTLQLNRAYLFALIVQILMHTVTATTPLTTFTLSTLLEFSVVGYENYAMILLSFHGTTSIVCIIALHAPCRRITARVLGIKALQEKWAKGVEKLNARGNRDKLSVVAPSITTTKTSTHANTATPNASISHIKPISALV